MPLLCVIVLVSYRNQRSGDRGRYAGTYTRSIRGGRSGRRADVAREDVLVIRAVLGTKVGDSGSETGGVGSKCEQREREGGYISRKGGNLAGGIPLLYYFAQFSWPVTCDRPFRT